MRRPRLQSIRQWHEENASKFDALGRIVTSSIRSLLAQAGIPFLDVTYRIKTLNSFISKIKNKRYTNPQLECTDILGVRIITYIESDIDRCSSMLRSSMQIDEANSLDKRALLEVDRIGYRSVHFVASLGPTRTQLPELRQYKDYAFEIQVRTVLQHAWAEIEHDRNYKLPTSLPPELERRLFLVSGVLELADREFSNLAADIEKYSKSVVKNTNAGDLSDGLNTPSLKVYCTSLAKRFLKTKISRIRSQKMYDDLVCELHDFGAQTLKDIDALFTPDFIAKYDLENSDTNDLGILRDAMMYQDLDKYFKEAWKERWLSIDPDDLIPLSSKYGDHAREVIVGMEIDIERYNDANYFDDEPEQ